MPGIKSEPKRGPASLPGPLSNPGARVLEAETTSTSTASHKAENAGSRRVTLPLCIRSSSTGSPDFLTHEPTQTAEVSRRAKHQARGQKTNTGAVRDQPPLSSPLNKLGSCHGDLWRDCCSLYHLRLQQVAAHGLEAHMALTPVLLPGNRENEAESENKRSAPSHTAVICSQAILLPAELFTTIQGALLL